MAKNMAFIENGTVTNILWCSDKTQDTETLISILDRPVAIGDTFNGSDFYRDGEKVLTPMEQLQKDNAEYEALINELYAEVTS